MATENYIDNIQKGWKVGDPMGTNDYKRILDKMNRFIANIPATSPQESKDFLIKAGIFDKNGNITKVYQK